MRPLFLFLLLGLTFSLFAQNPSTKKLPSLAEKTAGLTHYDGFYDFYWSALEGKIYLRIDRWEEEFLYVNSLSAGLGSNDIGLDRNQLGQNRVVRFQRTGPKVLLIERNLDYRAISDNEDERQSVADAFAQSVLAGFSVAAATDDTVLVDLTPMLMTDAHGVARRLKANKQGSFKIDAKRSVIHLDRTKNFPDNSEFEALLTFSGEPTGSLLRSVAPTPESFSVRQHHSFVKLPENDYEPRVFDPNSGYFPLTYADYATPIDQPLTKRFIQRHHLRKVDPTAELSPAVEPIVYYLDRGAPEPIRSALIEGASWWNQAFESAGYKDAFRVELLPEGADPLDVRYNVINWVHRSTRGWSYGSSVIDPRTGQILKGHVLLGSLRVRQDFLIAQGLINAYENGESPDPRMKEMALARLRQLSAHEVGHTLGLAHNFAASTEDRSSVMDYPHPYIILHTNGEVDFSEAYDVGIGAWDKRTILYGYQDFPPGTNTAEALNDILLENYRLKLRFISDPDARPVGSANSTAHLWDNQSNPSLELSRLTALRATALENFSLENIPIGSPLGKLENVFVPLYLMHRYQVEASSKLIGGYEYDYDVRGLNTPVTTPKDGIIGSVYPVRSPQQLIAKSMLLNTLTPDFLSIPQAVINIIPPQPYGYRRDRELFRYYTGSTFDPISIAESSAEHTLRFLLHPERLARIHTQSSLYPQELYQDINEYCAEIEDFLARQIADNQANPYHLALATMAYHRYIQHLYQLVANKDNSFSVRAAANQQLSFIRERALSDELKGIINLYDQQLRESPDGFKPAPAPRLPDGSPIGCGHFH